MSSSEKRRTEQCKGGDIFSSIEYWGITVGFHNWVYFHHLESLNQLNYLGHWQKVDFAGKGTGLAFTFKWGEEQKPYASMMIGKLLRHTFLNMDHIGLILWMLQEHLLSLSWACTPHACWSEERKIVGSLSEANQSKLLFMSSKDQGSGLLAEWCTLIGGLTSQWYLYIYSKGSQIHCQRLHELGVESGGLSTWSKCRQL